MTKETACPACGGHGERARTGVRKCTAQDCRTLQYHTGGLY